jgi:hypothetical protein
VAYKQTADGLAPDLGDQPAPLGFLRGQYDAPARMPGRRWTAHHRHDGSLLLGVEHFLRLGTRVIT